MINQSSYLGGQYTTNLQTQVQEKNGVKSEAQPMYLVVGQELIHALIGMDGYEHSDDNKKLNTYYNYEGKTKTEKEPLNELEAHGIGNYQPFGNAKRSSYPTENDLRKDHHLGTRVAYEPGYISDTHN